MSGSNCCFFTCIQISQEAGKVFWYSHLFKNFLHFIVIHTVKGFSVVNKADVFLEFSCFFLYFFALIAEGGFLISLFYSLEVGIQMNISFLFSFAFHFSSFLSYVRPLLTTILPFFISFSWGWFWSLPPVQCTNLCPQFFRHCLSYLIPWIYLSLPLYNNKWFDLDHT